MQHIVPHVQRTAILRTVEQQLIALAAGPASAHILNIYGITGIGKTVALRQIFEQVRTTSPVLWLDFDTARAEPERPTLNRQPLAALVSWLRYQLNDLADMPDDLPSGADQQQVGVASARLGPAASQPFVLLLDHLEDVSFWKWIQAEIIKPLVEQRPTLVICASQSPLFWHLWELREIGSARPLEALSEEDVADFLRQADRDLLTDSVLSLTRGYPLQLDALRPILLADTPTEPDEALPDLDSLLERLSPLTRHFLRYTGLLRRLEVPAMQHILNHTLPNWVGAGQTPHYLLLGHMLPELRDQGHLAAYQRNQGQQLHRPLRLALDARLRSSEPERYQQICGLLSIFYDQQVMQKPIHEQQLFNEWLYFSTAALHEPPTGTAREEWLAQAARLLGRARLAGKSLLVWFYRDRELLARLHALGLTEPLQELIGQHFDDDHHHAPPILNSTELVRYRRRLIEQWSTHPALADVQTLIPGGLFTLLAAISTLGLSFSAAALRERLNEWPDVDVSQITVNQAVMLLERFSLLSNDRANRVYQLSSHIYGLLTAGPALLPAPSTMTTPLEPGTAEGGIHHD